MTAEFTARNAESLTELQNNPDVELRRFPDDVLRQLRSYTEAIMVEMSDRDPRARRIFDSFQEYKARAEQWTRISETAYLNSREL